MSDEEILKKYNKNNPHPGTPFSREEYLIDNSKLRVFSWLSGKQNDIDIKLKNFRLELKKLIPELTIQLYFDIIVLGITNISDRPRCKICGKEVKFEGKISRIPERDGYTGYYKTCSGECLREVKRNICETAVKSGANINEAFRRKVSSDEYKKKMSSIKKGTVFSESHKNKISKAIQNFRKTTKGIEHTKKLAEIRSIKNMERLKSPEEFTDSSRKPRGRYVTGNYDSSRWNTVFRYDSSWELDFIKYTEKSCISGDIKIISRCQDSILYYKSIDDQLIDHHHRYLPDFYIEFVSGIKLVLEIKPLNIIKKDPVVTRKRWAAKKFYKKLGIKFIILSEKDLYNKRRKKKGIKSNFNIYDYII